MFAKKIFTLSFCFFVLCFHFPMQADDFVDDPSGLGDAGMSLSSLEGEPSAIVSGVCNAITGDYVDMQTDIVVPGVAPLSLQRFYCSSDTRFKKREQAWKFNHDISAEFKRKSKSPIRIHDAFGADTHFYYEGAIDKKTALFKASKSNWEKGVTNHRGGRYSIKNRKIYDKEKGIVLKLGSGTEYHFINFKKMHQKPLMSIIRPSGTNLGYEYNVKNGLSRVYTVLKNVSAYPDCTPYSLNWLKFDGYGDHKKILTVTGSDGQEVQYYYQRTKYYRKRAIKMRGKEFDLRHAWILSKVAGKSKPPEIYHYYQHKFRNKRGAPKLSKKQLPDNRYLEIEYYQKGFHNLVWPWLNEHIGEEDPRQGKVMILKGPAGTDKTPVPLNHFLYYPQLTHVYNAHDRLKAYHYDLNSRLSKIVHYNGPQHSPYAEELLYWDKEGNLLSKVFASASGTPYFCSQSQYDENDNAIKNFLYGNLTGGSAGPMRVDDQGNPLQYSGEMFCQEREYSKDGLNLLLRENSTVGKHDIFYVYESKTDRLSARYCMTDKIRKRQFYEYHAHGALKTEIEDDGQSFDRNDSTGVTERHIKRIQTNKQGLPTVMEELYFDFEANEEKLLKKTINYYSDASKLIMQEFYDCMSRLVYTLKWEYHPNGLLAAEWDRFGNVKRMEYDANGNLIQEVGPRPDHVRTYSYDFMNRLIREEEREGNGPLLAKTHRYDLLGHKVSSTDIFGNETIFEVDDFGRTVQIRSPAVKDQSGEWRQSVITKEYDPLGNVVSLTDAEGQTKRADYTIRGKPYRITYPDGTEEHFRYTHYGQLEKTVARNGTTTCYEYDEFGRPVKKEIYNPAGERISSSSRVYNAFHLLVEIDPNNAATRHFYDAAGRLIRTEKEEVCTEFFYDTFGRNIERKQYTGSNPQEYISHIYCYDFLNRLIEEKVADGFGAVYSEEHYAYDEMGNRILERKGSAITVHRYNAQGQILETADPLGNKTVFHYRYGSSPGVEMVDSLGRTTISTFDARGKLACIENKDPLGNIVQKTLYSYDRNGNKCCQQQIVIAGGREKETIKTLWEYDAMQRLSCLIEAASTPNQKVTSYHYNNNGELQKVVKNDGVGLSYSYDPLGRLLEHASDEGGFDYRYSYDALGNPVCILDTKTGEAIERNYDRLGRLLCEKQANGLQLSFTYDRMGRPLTAILPDGSGIRYVYCGPKISRIERVAETGESLYAHTYEEFDSLGNVCRSKLIGNAGEIAYAYDELGRKTAVSSAHWKETAIERDAAGNLTGRIIEDPVGRMSCEYAYDTLYQIVEENGPFRHVYENDSVSNHVAQDGQRQEYNALNQLIKTGEEQFEYSLNGNRTKDGNRTYAYDALDRLICVETLHGAVHYSYDACNRRVKKVWKPHDGTEELAKNFFYIGTDEIGSCDESGRIADLRIPGVTSTGESGIAVAIETEGRLFAPIYDHLGHLSCMLDAETGNPVETYRFSTFGDETLFGQEGTPIESALSPWRYANLRRDPDTGLIAYALRDYDSATCCWLTPDPIGFEGGPNLYAYVLNNPLVYFDRLGLYPDSYDPWQDYGFNHDDLMGEYNFLNRNPQVFQFNSFESIASYSSPTLNSIARHCIGYTPMMQSACDIMFNKSEAYSGLYDYNPGLLPSFSPKIGFVNGMMNDFFSSLESTRYLSKLAGGAPINQIYNASHGLPFDLAACFLNRCNIATNAVKYLHESWDRYFDSAEENGLYLQICHSQGAIHVNNALKSYDPSKAKRILVLAIAPGEIVSSQLCRKAINYVSLFDPIPFNDIKGMVNNRNDVRFLMPHSVLKFFDHEFTSPTYRKILKEAFNVFEKDNDIF